ncbi:PTS sugar transporter subunit IIA [Haloglycomyces albus]|uniref:PTS sugar transporter subunit IIA n=1 Tax=Haloglycomyces albus TaxID=526067 RepID=UPI00046D18F4|nr:PTS glucose transporter subunit IIA [Haloglycomyces albus]
MAEVLAPVAGDITPLDQVSDPVFAQGFVGPGLAVTPVAEPTTAVAAIGGTVTKLHPHAYVITGDDGRGVLVHLGIDTVELKGEGFTLLAAEGDTVTAGQAIVEWNPAEIKAGGKDTVCPVVALDGQPDAITDHATGEVSAGDRLFTWQ